MKLDRPAIAVLLACGALRAQNADAPSREPAEDDPRVLLSKALRRLKTADSVYASVEVEHEPAEPGVGAALQGMRGAGVMVVQTRVFGQEPPYEGAAEVFRDADGATVILSRGELPGFALYLGRGRSIQRTTFEDRRFSLDQLRTELATLVDKDSFVRHLLDAKLDPAHDASTGEITFRGEVSRDIVPPTVADLFPAPARVLGAEATLVVTPEGRLARAAVKITRSDPMRELMRGRRRRIVLGGGPGGVVPPPAEDEDDKKHDSVGGTTTYTLVFRDDGPSERAKAFQKEAERLLDAGAREGR